MIPLGNLLVGTVAAAFGVFPTLYAMSAISIVAALVVVRIPAVWRLPRGVAVDR
jgi:hypothetical protein